MQVHRHDPPLVWGRLHSADPELAVGVAVCECSASVPGRNLYVAVTYECVYDPLGVLKVAKRST